MRTRDVAACIGVFALGLISAPICGDEPVDQTRVRIGRDAQVELAIIFTPNFVKPAAARATKCLEKWHLTHAQHWREWRMVMGCSVTIRERDVEAFLGNLTGVQHRSISSIAPADLTFAVGPPMQVSDVYFVSPPEAWRVNDVLVFTNPGISRLLVYQLLRVQE